MLSSPAYYLFLRCSIVGGNALACISLGFSLDTKDVVLRRSTHTARRHTPVFTKGNWPSACYCRAGKQLISHVKDMSTALKVDSNVVEFHVLLVTSCAIILLTLSTIVGLSHSAFQHLFITAVGMLQKSLVAAYMKMH
jgi:hypothetical protein